MRIVRKDYYFIVGFNCLYFTYMILCTYINFKGGIFMSIKKFLVLSVLALSITTASTESVVFAKEAPNQPQSVSVQNSITPWGTIAGHVSISSGYLNLRASASSSSASIGQLSNRTTFTIYNWNSSQTWIQVNVQTNTGEYKFGWISVDFVVFDY